MAPVENCLENVLSCTSCTTAHKGGCKCTGCCIGVPHGNIICLVEVVSGRCFLVTRNYTVFNCSGNYGQDNGSKGTILAVCLYGVIYNIVGVETLACKTEELMPLEHTNCTTHLEDTSLLIYRRESC